MDAAIRYLGIITTGIKVTLNNDIIKHNLFAACNCLYANAKKLDEIIHLSMQECYCLSIITYADSVVKYTKKTGSV